MKKIFSVDTGEVVNKVGDQSGSHNLCWKCVLLLSIHVIVSAPLYIHHVWIPKAYSWASILSLLWCFLSFCLWIDSFFTCSEPPSALVKMIIWIILAAISSQRTRPCIVHFILKNILTVLISKFLVEVLCRGSSWPWLEMHTQHPLYFLWRCSWKSANAVSVR